MENTFSKKASRIFSSSITLSVLFFISGIIGGLLGSGGGILTVFVLKNLIKDKRNRKRIFATSMAIILPMSAICSTVYSKKLNTDPNYLLYYLLPGISGGLLGTVLFDKINYRYLNFIFSVLMIISGILTVI